MRPQSRVVERGTHGALVMALLLTLGRGVTAPSHMRFGSLSPLAAMSIPDQSGPPSDTQTHAASETTIHRWPRPSREPPLTMSGELSAVSTRTNLLPGRGERTARANPEARRNLLRQAIPGNHTLVTASPVVA